MWTIRLYRVVVIIIGPIIRYGPRCPRPSGLPTSSKNLDRLALSFRRVWFPGSRYPRADPVPSKEKGVAQSGRGPLSSIAAGKPYDLAGAGRTIRIGSCDPIGAFCSLTLAEATPIGVGGFFLSFLYVTIGKIMRYETK